ncbi:MAG: hypothetical protein JNL67_11220 [Planctomycetaceae bacterium]|nr:hypothetical protein [Planctomycetaceae bacterium]
MNAKRLIKTKRGPKTTPVAPGVTRFDIEERRTHGYMVRIARHGARHQKFFSDLKCGGMEKALAAAKRQYLTWAATLPPRLSNKDRLTTRNRSGRVGVYVASAKEADGQAYEAYCASWTDENGRRWKISFSSQRYGKKRAWQLANLAREQMTTKRKKLLTLLDKKSNDKKTGKKPRRQ